MSSFDPSSIRAITFDLYGTLLDLEATFSPAFASFLQERGAAIDAAEFVRTWEWAYLHEGMVDTFLGGPRTPFEQLRRITLSQQFTPDWNHTHSRRNRGTLGGTSQAKVVSPMSSRPCG